MPILGLLDRYSTKVLCQSQEDLYFDGKALAIEEVSDIINPARCRPDNPKLVRCGTNSVTR